MNIYAFYKDSLLLVLVTFQRGYYRHGALQLLASKWG